MNREVISRIGKSVIWLTSDVVVVVEFELVQGYSVDLVNRRYLFQWLHRWAAVVRVRGIGEIQPYRPSHAYLDHGMSIAVVQGQ